MPWLHELSPITIIRIKTSSTDWDLYILQNDNGYIRLYENGDIVLNTGIAGEMALQTGAGELLYVLKGLVDTLVSATMVGKDSLGGPTTGTFSPITIAALQAISTQLEAMRRSA